MKPIMGAHYRSNTDWGDVGIREGTTDNISIVPMGRADRGSHL